METTFVAKDEKHLTRQGNIVFFNIKDIIMKKEVPESILEREVTTAVEKTLSLFLEIMYTSTLCIAVSVKK